MDRLAQWMARWMARWMAQRIAGAGVGALCAAAFVAVVAATGGAQVLPPNLDSECAGQTPILVASDEAAQSDLYSATTLAGVLETTCIVLAGARDEPMAPEQVARLDAAIREGWVVGGQAAVPATKVADYAGLVRIDGVDRWHTARLVGAIAADPDGDIEALTQDTAPPEDEVGGGSVMVDDVEVRLPPGLDAPCDDQVPIVVAVDAAAQSDLYSAATLAGVLNTSCYVLAGARDEPTAAEQVARLAAANAAAGYIVGGEAAVPPEKVASFAALTRIGGEDRWHTARLIGEVAARLGRETAVTTTTERPVARGGGSTGRTSGGTRRAPTRPNVVPSVGTTTTTSSTSTTTSTTEPSTMPTSTSTEPDTTTSTTDPSSVTSSTTTTSTTNTTSTTTTSSTTTTTEPLPSAATELSYDVVVSVPDYDRDGVGPPAQNWFAGASMSVAFWLKSDPAVDAWAAGCTQDAALSGAAVSFTVDAATGGATTRSGVLPTLIDRPEGSAERCVYTLTFDNDITSAAGGTDDWVLSLPDWQATADVGGTNPPTVTRAYRGMTYFAPAVTVSLPFKAAGSGSGVSAVDGERATVTYSSATAGCVAAGSPETYVVDSDQGVSGTQQTLALQGAAARLIDRALRTTTRCSYTASFSDPTATMSAELPGVARPDDAQVSATTPATGTYFIDTVDSSLMPSFTIGLPGYANDDPANNVFAGLTVPLTFAQVAGVEHAPMSSCTDTSALGVSGTVNYIITATGELERAASAPALAFVDVPGGQLLRCRYTVTYPAAATSAETPTALRELATHGAAVNVERELHGAAAPTSPTYTGTVRFAPTVTIDVPDGVPADTEFVVAIDPANATPTGCSDVDVTFAVTGGAIGSGGAIAPSSFTPDGGTETTASALPPLIDRPAGEPTARCAYTVTFPDTPIIDGDTYIQQSTPDETIDPAAADAEASVTYEPMPTPATELTYGVAVSVPDYDRDGVGPPAQNWFAGAQIDVSFTLKSDPAVDTWAAGCTQSAVLSGMTVTFTVDAAAGGTATRSGALPVLIDQPEGSTERCVYTLTFADNLTSAAGGTGDWVLSLPTGEATADVGGTNPPTATRAYRGMTYFAPDVSVSVPFKAAGSGSGGGAGVSAVDGQRVTVTYSSATAGCVAAGSPEMYVVDSDQGVSGDEQTLALSGAAARLVDRAAGTTTRCSYTASFSDPTANMSAELPGVAKPDDAQVSATTPATARYFIDTEDSMLMPSFTIGLPGYANDDPSSNVFAGLTVPLVFAQVAGAEHAPMSICTDTSALGTVNYVITATGELALAAGEPALAFVDVPGGQLLRCRYTVTYPAAATSAETPTALRELATDGAAVNVERELHGAAAPTSPTYTGTVRFAPTVTIDVPDGVPADTEFVVAIDPANATPTGCSDVDVTFAVTGGAIGSGGAIAPSSFTPDGGTETTATALPPLIDRPAGEPTARCAYAVTFPDAPMIDGDTYIQQTSPDETINPAAADAEASVTYEPLPGPRSSPYDPPAVVPAPFIAVSSGDRHACGLQADGSLRCWGDNRHGQTDVPPMSFSAVAAGSTHTCAIRSDDTPDSLVDGTLICWGDDANGRATPPQTGSYSAVATGGSHSCAISAGGASDGALAVGSVVCWGNSSNGLTSPPGGTFRSISLGDQHGCGVKTDGTAACWGPSTFGETTEPSGSFIDVAAGMWFSCWVQTAGPLECAGLNNAGQREPPKGLFTHVAAGERHGCAIQADGGIACWGEDDFQESAAPQQGEFTAITAGSQHTCALSIDGSVTCWGHTNHGQAAPLSGTFSNLSAGLDHTCGVRTNNKLACWGKEIVKPGLIPSASFTAVAAGGSHSCGIRSGGASDGSIDCWGSGNAFGQQNHPSGSFAEIDAGQSHSCARTASRAIRCWGNPADGRTTVPTGTWDSMSVGTSHACGVHPGGQVDCWGNNDDGKATAPRHHFTAVAAGGTHTCGLRANARIACWGRGGDGQTAAPTASYTAVAAGDKHSCGLLRDKTVTCWGDNSAGQLDVPNGQFTALVAAGRHSCALRVDGTAVCWGAGQRWTNVRGSFTAVSDGGSHSCGLRANGAVLCWGDNRFGQTEAPAGAFAAISAGRSHSCALRTDGSVACWGDNTQGQTRAPMAPTDSSFSAVSAGATHSCGLLSGGASDGSVICWGNSAQERTMVPAQTFKSVSAGTAHSCGVRAASGSDSASDGMVSCWGHDTSGETTPPDEVFIEVVAANALSCGIRDDGTISCWGSPLEGDPTPSGSFTDVAAGVDHVCGVKTDGSVVCWGEGGSQQTAAPEQGTFSQVSAGGARSCGVRTGGGFSGRSGEGPDQGADGSIVCWGYTNHSQAAPPSGAFGSVSAGGEHSCGVVSDDEPGSTTDGSVACWGNDGSDQASPPSHDFAMVSAGGQHSCGVVSDDAPGSTTDGSIVCWGDSTHGQAANQSGSFDAVSVGGEHSCAIVSAAAPGGAAAGTVTCWGRDFDGRLNAPDETFSSVSAGARHSCGLLSVGTAACWGNNGAGRATAPSGMFSAVAAGGAHSCAIRSVSEGEATANSIACWGSNSDGQTNAPSGSFRAVATGGAHSCAIRSVSDSASDGDEPAGEATDEHTDVSIVCWGDNSAGQIEAPDGTFSSVTAGAQHSCAVRSDDSDAAIDGTLVCWGAGEQWRNLW